MDTDEIDSEQSLTESHSSIVAAPQGTRLNLDILAHQLRPYLKQVVRNEVANYAGEIREDESDLVQQTLTRAVERAEAFRGSTLSEWRSWLAAIARSQVRDSKRFWNANRRSFRFEVDIAGNASDIASDSVSPSGIMQQDELSKQLTECLAHLSPTHRQIIQWRQQDELSHAEIAERLSISVEAARQRAKSAMDALRKVWHSDFNNDA